MTKANLKAGQLVFTADGKARLVVNTKNDGLVLMAADNKALKVSRLNNDLTHGEYREDKTVVEVYDVMETVNGHLFDTQDRGLLFERNADKDNTDDDCTDYDDCDCEECDGNCSSTFTKNSVAPGMLAVTRDGQNRLAIPTSDKGLVLATPDSKFVRLDKLNDDLTIRDYNNANKNVDKVYGFASGDTHDFYSEANRPLLFDRNAN